MFVNDIVTSLLELGANHHLLFVATAVLFYYVLNRETRNVPPGPIGLPVLGYIPFLQNRTAHEQLWKLSKKYGSVFSIQLGMNNCIIVNDHKSALELMKNDATHARPKNNMFDLFMGHDNLVSWEGPMFREHRKFSLKALRTVGVGKPEIESLIGEEITYMLDKIDKDGGAGTRAVNIDDYLTSSTSNVVNAVITGSRFDYDHPIRVKQDALFSNSQALPMMFTGYVAHFIPVFALLNRIPSKQSTFFKEGQDMVNTYLKQEAERQAATAQSAPDANLMSAYIAEAQLKKANGDETLLNGLGSALISAGSGTVRDSLEWAFLYCAVMPDIQDKLIAELQRVIGFDRRPVYADRKDMPYTQAFLWETMRHSTNMVINLPRVALADIPFNGYIIPKGYHIYVNTWACHNDPGYWDKPEEFKVERFLSPEGDKLVKHEAFMPFSSGGRSCPGEPLAQVELFIYLVMTLQRYKIQEPTGVKLSLEPVVTAFNLSPKHNHLQFISRAK